MRFRIQSSQKQAAQTQKSQSLKRRPLPPAQKHRTRKPHSSKLSETHKEKELKESRFFNAWMVPLLAFLIFIVVMAFTMGCATGGDAGKDDPNSTVYKYDLVTKVNGYTVYGVGVIPYFDVYNLSITSKVDVDLLTIKSCHRDEAYESVIDTGWFSKKRGFNYTYTPGTLERSPGCVLRIAAYNQSGGQNAWGLIAFESPDLTLPAVLYCNGDVKHNNGISACQSSKGLFQSIVFPVKARVASNSIKTCALPTSPDGLTWTLNLSAGECTFTFMEVDGTHRVHNLTTVAYTNILYRGN